MKGMSFISFLLFVSITLLGQKDPFSFGNVNMNDLLLKSCPFEPEAPAMKLLDIEEITFDIFTYGTKMKTEKRVRIKIFNEKGYKYASVRIPYLNKKRVAKIKELAGFVYNLDASGKIVKQKLEEKDFFTVKAIENIGIVNFTFPNIKHGSVIEYQYTTIENDIIGISPWIIQGEIPVAYTSVSLTTPARSGITEKIFGSDTVEQSMYLLKYDQFKRTMFSKRDIPSFHPEPYMSSYNDNLLKVVFLFSPWSGSSYKFTAATSKIIWQSAGNSLLHSKYFEEQIGKTIPGTEGIIDSAKKFVSKTERINFVYETVKKRWQGKMEQTLQTENLEEAWNTREATTTEINLILLNLLEKADIKCVPVLVSTRENGKVDKNFPSIGQLNGVDVMAFDSTAFYILDASIRYQSFLNPPLNILNREAFVMSPDSMQWVTVVDQRPLMKQVAYVSADMKEDGMIEGTASVQYFDYAKSAKLDTTLNKNKQGDEKYMDKKPGLKIISAKQDITENPDDPLFETIEFTYEPQNTNEFYFIDPQIFTERSKNPFLADKRNTDIDLECNQLFLLTMQIHIPGSFEIDHLPQNLTIRAPDSSFFYKVTFSLTADVIYLSEIFEIKRAIFSRDEYAGIQDFFKRMYAVISKEIILKKKK